MNYNAMNIDPTARVARDATVIGNVTLGPESLVLFGSVLRGDCEGRIVVGARSNIQDLVCVHLPMGGETVLEPDVTVGHGAILHGCTIGSGSLIGMGAIVLDNAKIGRECLIGAGAVVTPGKEIPDRSVVMGTPGRVVREVTEEDLVYIRESVNEYLKIGRELVEQGIIVEGFAPNGS